jgi:Zn-dependent protease
MPNVSGALHLFRFSGISVYLHWSWFAVALFELYGRSGSYASPIWNVLEYLALFVIVTLHEFGHAFACRSTGGTAERIVLWPLGGVAYVQPPERPGAWLWSIVAGPLVNLALVPVLGGAWWWSAASGWAVTAPQLHKLLGAVFWINVVMLVFNLLPFHPLDGGQIVRSLLWFVVGRGRSLTITSLFGFVGAALVLVLAFVTGSFWFGILALFIALSCRAAFLAARRLTEIDALVPRAGFTCPACEVPPPIGELWLCGRCHAPFDTFAAGGRCPHFAAELPMTRCPACGAASEVSAWRPAPAVAHPAGT